MDIVMNHSSNKCERFLKSEKNIFPYSDYYFWREDIPKEFKPDLKKTQ